MLVPAGGRGAAQAGGSSLPEAPSSLATVLARLTGSVLSDDGAVVTGAAITLHAQAGSPELHTTSGVDGSFRLSGIAPGRWTLTVTLPGFTSSVRDVDLLPGQALQLEPALLALATVHISVDAMTPEQFGLEELHAEEHQRVVGLLPNFYVSYTWTAPPLTAGQKFQLATKNVLDPGNLALVGVTAGVQQAANAFPGYGQGAAGYGRRYGADLGNLVIGSYMGGAVLPALFHQDPRFFFKATGTLKSRFLYAVSRAVITRGDNGHNQPNFAGVLGDLSAGALSNIYYPASDRQGATLFLENGLLGIAGDAMNDVVQELILPRFTTRGKRDQHVRTTP